MGRREFAKSVYSIVVGKGPGSHFDAVWPGSLDEALQRKDISKATQKTLHGARFHLIDQFCQDYGNLGYRWNLTSCP